MTAAASRKLRGSTDNFNTAQFTAATVSFTDTIFTGGVIDLSHTLLGARADGLVSIARGLSGIPADNGLRVARCDSPRPTAPVLRIVNPAAQPVNLANGRVAETFAHVRFAHAAAPPASLRVVAEAAVPPRARRTDEAPPCGAR